jgi:hypothetical protein
MRTWIKIVSLLLALTSAPSFAQQPSPADGAQPPNMWNRRGGDGGGNGQTIDPTKNVLDLVEAAIRRQDDLRAAEAKLQTSLREAETKFNAFMRETDVHRINDLREADVRRLNELRDAETRRINELATQKQIFDLELARVIRAGLDASTLLLATQLKEVKTDASDRMAKLEQFANEQRGRASATDPAYTKIVEEVRSLIVSRSDLAGKSTGQGEVVAWIVGGLGLLFGAIMAGIALNNMRRQPVVRRLK